MARDSELNDQLIVNQVLSGQKDLFRLLVRQHEKAVYAMGMSFLRNAEDSGDFTQEVFLKAYRSLGSFQGRSRFSTWLYKIAYNTAVNEVSRRRDFLSFSERDDSPENTGPGLSSTDSPEKAALKNAAKEAVRQAVSELPERFKVCVDLFFFYDRSYQEIEAITGFPVNTVKSHVFRAKKLLREKLQALGAI